MRLPIFFNGLNAALLAAVAQCAPDITVDLLSNNPSVQTILATQVCAGLFNSDENGLSVYTLMDSYDSAWLLDIEGINNPETTSSDDFLTKCLGNTPLVKGYILYDYSVQQAIVPNLITLASMLNAIPLEYGHPSTVGSVMVYDAVSQWKDFAAVDATQYMYDNYVNMTTAMAYMNPGYDNAANPSNPPLTRSPNLKLTDHIVKEKLFNLYMNDACIPGTAEYDLMLIMTRYNTWPK